MNSINGVCAAKGFLANGIYCGIKHSKKLDLALIYSKVPAKAACVFTSNAIKANHILVDKKHLAKSSNCQAIVVNSGNANCANGKKGLSEALGVCSALAKILDLNNNEVLIASTGIIGKKFPATTIEKGLANLVMGLSRYNADKAALGILTTDTHLKEYALNFKLGGKTVNIGGMVKGAGMIHPNMATLLAFITTDVNISLRLLKKALKKAVDNSFNLISVDECMSTNDTAAILANSLAANKLINSESKDFKVFCSKLETVCLELAKMLVKDAEGATKFITVKIKGAKNIQQAKKAALAIATSMLFKAACFGNDPNWGRIISALGSSLPDLKEKKISIALNKKLVFSHGNALKFPKGLLQPKNIEVLVNLGSGKKEITFYTSDLSLEYVKINARYN